MNILWDFDGTLFDTCPIYTQLLRQVIGQKFDKQEIYQKLKISYPHAREFFALTEEQDREYSRLKKNISPKDTKPFDSLEEILKFANKNVIMTHKSKDGVLAILEYYGFEKYFVDMVTVDDGFPRKPHAASYQYLHDKHGIDLAIGDREFDLLPAREIGIATCAFQNQIEFADYHITDYSEFFTKDIPNKF